MASPRQLGKLAVQAGRRPARRETGLLAGRHHLRLVPLLEPTVHECETYCISNGLR